nr:copia protein [Tanacetum cinerariifolium]
MMERRLMKIQKKENECNDQEKEDNVNSTNNVNTVSSTVNGTGTNEDNELPFDLNMPVLEDVSILNFSNDDEDDGPEEPKKVSHALKDPSWIEAMNKKDERGTVIRNKARLVAQGYTQEEGIDNDEVFALIARIKAIRLFLDYASFKDFVLYQMDVKGAFLHEKIEEEKSRLQAHLWKLKSLCSRMKMVKKWIFTCIGQPKLGLWYPKDFPFDLVAYTDSDYARASLDRKSTTGGKANKSVRLMMEKLFGMELELILLVHARVDGKKIIITKASIRRDLQLADEEDDVEIFDMNDLGGELVFVAEKEFAKDVNENVVKEAVNAAQDSTATTTITTKEISLARVLEALKTLRPKDKGKGIMIEENVKPKKKDQIGIDEEAGKRLQAEFDEKERLARERAQKEQEAIEYENVAINLTRLGLAAGHHREYLHKWGFAAALAVLITGASQSKQHAFVFVVDAVYFLSMLPLLGYSRSLLKKKSTGKTYLLILAENVWSILTDLQVTPTKPGRMTKPYSSHRFIANYFNAGNLKIEVKKIIKEQVKEQVKISYVVAVDLSEMELKNILIEKMEGNKSIQRSDKKRNLYKALVEAYESDKIILDTYEETVTLKRHRDDDVDKDEEPSASASESAFEEEPMQTTCQMEEPSDLEFDTGAEDQPIVHFLINRLKVDTLTPKLLAGPTYELMKGSCKSLVELEYHLEEVFKATTDQLDWVNPEGASSRKYTTSIMKTKAADYGHIKWIEDLVPKTMWIEEPIGYGKHALWGRRIIAVTELKIVEWHNYKHLDWITMRRDDDKLYKFKEGNFKRLRIQDIEDMLMLLVQGKLTNLTVEERFSFNVSLRMFTRSINKDKKNRLMWIDELHTFSDGTLIDVRTALDDRLKGIRMHYLPQSIWRKSDKDREADMIQAIDKRLKTRRIMRRLERKNTDSLNTKISKLNEELSDSENTLYRYKLGLSQVEARLVEFKTQEIKFCEKIRSLEFDIEVKNNKIENLMNELEQVKKEKEGLDSKLTGFQSASKDLDTLLGRLPEFADDTITDYSRPSPSIESNINDLQNSNSSIFEHGKSSSSIMSKPMIKFVKAANRPTVIKNNKVKTARKSPVKYAEMYRNTSKSPKVRGNQRNWNNLKSQQLGKDFLMKNKACFKCDYFHHLAYDCGIWVEKGKTWPKNNFAHKYVTPRAVLHKTRRTPSTFTADLENKGKSIKASACWIWRPKQNTSDKGYWDNGCSRYMTGNISYLSEYEPYDGGYVLFGQGGGKITGKDHLGKFDAKGDEGYFVGYSMSSKAFRVFNKRTKKVEENLHVYFLKNKLIEKGAGLN